MKSLIKKILKTPNYLRISPILLSALLLFSSCAHRIADLTMTSTRNIDSSASYKELQRYVVGKDKAIHAVLFIGPLETPDIEDAIDKAVKKVPGGEFMKNIVIREKYIWYLFFSMRTFQVEGDVWGTASE